MDAWNIQASAYLWSAFIVTVTYLAVLIGLVGTAPEYIETLEKYIKVYVAIFLILRFNPFTSTGKFTELDRKIVFASALTVLTTSALNNTIQYYLAPLRQMIHDYVRPLLRHL
jgi:hypothetical protein